MLNSKEIKPVGILVADDELGILDILSEVLEDRNSHVKTVSNGKEAFDVFMEDPTRYDLILTDVKMPELDGIDLVHKIRSDKNIKQPKIILMTGWIDIDLENYIDIVEDYFFKPFKTSEVKEKISKLLA